MAAIQQESIDIEMKTQTKNDDQQNSTDNFESSNHDNSEEKSNSITDVDLAQKTSEEACESPANIEQNQLRRSTRVSAKRAQERMRGELKEDQEIILSSNQLKKDDRNEDSKMGRIEPEPPTKVRKVADPKSIDTGDPHFAIQEDDNGDIVMLSDDSEVSSLHSDDIEVISKNYGKLMSKELTQEQLSERERMLQELKMQLRLEESRLALMRKIRSNQHAATKAESLANSNHVSQTPRSLMQNNAMATAKGGVSVGHQPGRPAAYQPPIAAPPLNSRLGASGQQLQQNKLQAAGALNAAAALAKGTLPGLANAKQPQLGNAANALQKASAAALGKGLPAASAVNVSSTVSQSATSGQNRQVQAAALADGQTPAQRQAAAKLALRKQLEKTLLQIPPPKPPPPEMHFVPNPNQPDFLYLCGLDDVVQRLLEQKERHQQKHQPVRAENGQPATPAEPVAGEKENQEPTVATAVSKIGGPTTPAPFVCAQCGIDFTPFWKMEKGRIMCEQCVRTNQKKALKAEHTNRLKQAFVKALQQEQEIDRQIKEGTFNFNILGAAGRASPQQHTTTNSAAVASSSSSMKSGNFLSGSASSGSISDQRHHHATSSSGSQKRREQTSTQSTASNSAAATAAAQAVAAAQAAAAAAALNPLAAAALSAAFPGGAANLPLGFPAQMVNVGWNPLLATRFPAAAAAAAAAAMGSLPPNWMQNLPRDLVKNLQQQNAAANAAAAALQRQFLLDMMPRPQKWK